MQIKKLNSSSIGSHYHEQALILSNRGEIFVTKDELTADGYELLKFQTYDLEGLTSLINKLLRGVQITAKARVVLENEAISVSPVANLYAIDSGGEQNAVLSQIVGGYESQLISIISPAASLAINSNNNIIIDQPLTLNSPYDILLLQRLGNEWIIISNSTNH